MKQVIDWLEKLGMSEYTQRFVEDDIDVSVLRRLTDRDRSRSAALATRSRRRSDRMMFPL